MEARLILLAFNGAPARDDGVLAAAARVDVLEGSSLRLQLKPVHWESGPLNYADKLMTEQEKDQLVSKAFQKSISRKEFQDRLVPILEAYWRPRIEANRAKRRRVVNMLPVADSQD